MSKKEKLKNLLYKKERAEATMAKFSHGIKVYGNYVDLLKDKLSKAKGLEKANLEKELLETEWKLRNMITPYKMTKRDYEHFLIPEIESVADEKTRKSIEFQDVEKEAKELAQYELYGKTVKDPDNVEHLEIIDQIKHQIDLLKDLGSAKEKEVKKKTVSELDKAKMRTEIYEHHIAVLSLQKRLNKRTEYYEDQFLPTYTEDMKELDKYFDVYFKRATEMAKVGIDPKLTVMLNEYDKNKDDNEKLWLFYTALRNRVDTIAKAMRRNKGAYKGNMKLAKKIR